MPITRLNGDFSRTIPNYSGEWLLSEEQVEVLELHTKKMAWEIIKHLDSEYRLRPESDANWPMLGHHLIEMLSLADHRAFLSIMTRMVVSMTNSVSIDNPFVAASIAESGMVARVNYDQILDIYLNLNSYGLAPFATGYLRLGDVFSTLWALRMVTISDRIGKYSKVISKAIESLAIGVKDLTSNPDHLGFCLYVATLLQSRIEDYSLRNSLDTLTEFCFKTICDDESWRKVDHNLRAGGFVCYDLLYASERFPDGVQLAEKWLLDAFSLDILEPTGFPATFKEARKVGDNDVPLDVWFQGDTRALIASVIYLKMRNPRFTIVDEICANYSRANAQKDYLGHYFSMVSPYLPSIKRIESLEESLTKFWDDGESYNNSVFISRWMGYDGFSNEQNPIADKLAFVIKDTLAEFNLVGRYAGDVGYYSPQIWENNELYLRGCKYGIALFEGMPGNQNSRCGVNHNVLIEAGFMWGKGAEVLILRDPKVAPHLPTDLNGYIHGTFTMEDENLTQLREEVRKWAASLVSNESEVQDQHTDSNENSGDPTKTNSESE